MGVERAVTRWHIQRQSLLLEIQQLESQLEQSSSHRDEQVGEAKEVNVTEISQQLTMAHEKLRIMGHCPRPMMG